MIAAKELKETLSTYPQEVLINLLAKIYHMDGAARKEIDFFLQGVDCLDERLAEVIKSVQELSRHSAGEIKALFAEYMKTEKNRKKRIDVLYFFIETALTSYSNQECDHRMIMFASSSYGRAVKMMDKELWDIFFEKSYSIAEQFYAIPMEAGVQAVRYYQEAKNKYS